MAFQLVMSAGWEMFAQRWALVVDDEEDFFCFGVERSAGGLCHVWRARREAMREV